MATGACAREILAKSGAGSTCVRASLWCAMIGTGATSCGCSNKGSTVRFDLVCVSWICSTGKAVAPAARRRKHNWNRNKTFEVLFQYHITLKAIAGWPLTYYFSLKKYIIFIIIWLSLAAIWQKISRRKWDFLPVLRSQESQIQYSFKKKNFFSQTYMDHKLKRRHSVTLYPHIPLPIKMGQSQTTATVDFSDFAILKITRIFYKKYSIFMLIFLLFCRLRLFSWYSLFCRMPSWFS